MFSRTFKAVTGMVLALTFISVVQAKSGTEMIEVNFRNISLVVDGERHEPKEEPLIYNGQVYLPLSEVATAINKPMSWDGKTSTVFIGEHITSTTSLSDMTGEVPPFNVSAKKWSANNSHAGRAMSSQKMRVGGKTYENGIMLEGQFAQKSHIYWNLNGKFSTVTGKLGYDNNYTVRKKTQVGFLADGKVLKTYWLRPGAPPEDVNLDVEGVLSLEFQAVDNNGTLIDLVDLKAHK